MSNKEVQLQGVGKMPGKPVKELKPGDVVFWNFGYSSEVLEMKPTKTGKTFDVLLKCNQSGNIGTRRLRAERLVAIGR